MKNLVLVILLFTLMSLNSKSQNYSNINYGKSLNEVGQKLIVINDSTVMLFGWGQEGSFVLYKIKASGDTLFTRYIELPFFSLGNDILKIPNGDFILIGENGGLIKINEFGEIVWSVHNDTISQSAGVLINDTCFAIAGQRPIFSHIREVPDLGPDSIFCNDIYICLYNQSGKLLKDLTYSFVDKAHEMSNDIIVNSSNDLVILGNAYYNGMPNEFLLTTDLDFNIQLDTLYEYPGIYIGNEIKENSNGNYIICGRINTNSIYDLNILVQEINSSGNIQWKKTFDLNGFEGGNSIIESDGFYYLTGVTANRNATEQNAESFLLKLDSKGDTVFSQIYILPDWQSSMDLQELNDTTLLLFGSTSYNTNGGSDFHLIYCDKTNGFSDLQGYESIFGKEATQWNMTIGNLWGTATAYHKVAGDTVINGKEYKIIDGYEGQEDYRGFLREDSIAGKAWYCNSRNHEEILIMDMGLKVGDTFYIGGNWNPNPGNYKVDLVYVENGRKHIRFNFTTPLPGEVPFELIEGITSNMGFRYQDGEYGNNFNPKLLCSYKDRIQVYGLGPCDFVGIEENEVANGIKVFPNPSLGLLNIQVFGNNNQHGKYTIINMEGKALLISAFGTNKAVDLTGLPSGMYLMIFENEKNEVIGQKKIVKE